MVLSRRSFSACGLAALKVSVLFQLRVCNFILNHDYSELSPFPLLFSMFVACGSFPISCCPRREVLMFLVSTTWVPTTGFLSHYGFYAQDTLI